MVHLHQLPALHLLALILLFILLIDNAGVVHEQLVIVKFLDYELLLKLVVRIDEELTTHEEQCVGHYVHKLLHCGQCDSLSLVRQESHHALEEGRSHESICELNDLPLSDLLILLLHILSP